MVASMYRMKLLLLILVFFLLPAQQPAFGQYPLITAQDIKPLVTQKKALLIDARLPEEYVAGHIPGSINIPAERMKQEATRLPKNKKTPIVFYCRGVG
jgi:rhodanese-related sulfurtransferase